MSKYVEELLASILKEYARCEKGHHDPEAKSIFRLLNCCPLQGKSQPPANHLHGFDDPHMSPTKTTIIGR
jgi:hypothetical protein